MFSATGHVKFCQNPPKKPCQFLPNKHSPFQSTVHQSFIPRIKSNIRKGHSYLKRALLELNKTHFACVHEKKTPSRFPPVAQLNEGTQESFQLRGDLCDSACDDSRMRPRSTPENPAGWQYRASTI